MGKPNIWEGWYQCQVDGCEEAIYLLREEPGPDGWQAQVLHDHEQGAWVVAVFPHAKGQRYWAEVKRMRGEIAAQKKAANEAVRVRRDSRPQSRSRRSSSTTEAGQTSAETGRRSGAPSTETPMHQRRTTTSSDSSSATPATSTETSSTSLAAKKASTFLDRLHSSQRSSDE